MVLRKLAYSTHTHTLSLSLEPGLLTLLLDQTYPLDTRKTRAQSVLLGKTEEIGEASRAVSKASMYKGLSIILLRTGINNMVLLSLFEYIKLRINQLEV